VQRVYLHADIYDTCLAMILNNMKSFVVGDPRLPETDVGPMISEADAVRAEEKIKQAVMRGARILAGGVREGALFYPTVLERASSEMSVCSSEMFAPVITVHQYTDVDEAVRQVNESRYGLQGSIFTNSLDVLERTVTKFEVGAVIINDYPTFREDSMPYGGTKFSGIGREGPKYLIDEFMEKRLVVMRRTSP
ncbi:MAG TPA: aldehyde dehydrogenase family protein, partial [Methanocorpusculum sp.]|nr:aldehyde dehydrogenase family protein [Methanocorpusculum sp.]